LDEEKSKLAGLAYQKWYWQSIFAQFAEANKREHQSLTLVREECNKHDLTASPCI
jgi:hypothetical protein